jgi:indolepyruvate ferredoxin oxidoreductase alpha subunit
VRRILAATRLAGAKRRSRQAARAVPRLSAPQRLQALRDLDCIVAGDIGCYSLGVLPPFEAMDTLVCMGAAIGVGLGLRHVLPPEEARAW